MNCQICGSTKNVVNHHLSYDPEEIITVCRSCHRKTHNKIKIVRPKNFNSKVLEDNPIIKIYEEDLKKLHIRKIDTDAKSLADVIHELIKEPRGG